MTPDEALQSAADSLLAKAQGAGVSDLAVAVDKATGVYRYLLDNKRSHEDLRKAQLENKKLEYEISTTEKRDRLNALKELIAICAPIFTTVVLAGTLALQTWQFTSSEKARRDAATEAGWENALKLISDYQKEVPAVAALQPFLQNPAYQKQARAAIIQVLINGKDEGLFTNLFDAAFLPSDWSMLPDLVALDRALGNKERPLDNKTWVDRSQSNDWSRLSSEEVLLHNYLNNTLPITASRIGEIFKLARPESGRPDLSSAYIEWVDWSGANLQSANVENAWITAVSLDNADLSKITAFANAGFYQTNWWKAKSISPELFGYLKDHYPCKPQDRYGPNGTIVGPNECNDNMSRLERSLH